MIGKISDSGLDLLNRLLVMNPSKRLNAEEALKHEYFLESKTDMLMLKNCLNLI